MDQSIGQFLRYATVGVAINALGYLLYLAIAAKGVDPKLAATFAFVTISFVGFALNRAWTFEVVRSRSSLARYTIAYVAAYLSNVGGLYAFVDWGHYPHEIVQALLFVPIAVCLFLVQKFWVFPKACS